MKKPLILLSLIASLGAGAGYAQSADGGDPATPPADPGIDTGKPAQNVPYVKEVYDDWTLNCIKNAQDAEVCRMIQMLDDGEGNEIAQVVINRVENSGQIVAVGEITVPLETSLRHRLRISVDGRESKEYDFTVCTRLGCTAQVGFTEEVVSQFKAGKEAVINIVPYFYRNQSIPLATSLKGFTAAFDETTAMQP
ncbi:invasion-associated locus B family protein [Mameliella alba]|uniref:invasion associated locus B family protein n=1 Tax=Mameliella TaxID=1434019 RepID=UPI000882C2FF|nr:MULTISPECIES: invasion associated locus B family protein [Mameliella]MCR9275846.1 invasion associated locus B family protein [Paracoccaceae bacterium]OWV50115.1 invasion associated locus B family protein [Mameliella alba]OWV60010.1 invasion associated locus B family protein [Mameliella alba]PTR42501.1 invasion protein IalB [Mameliella alba]SDC13287.1 Invasion protein IalB, involved in pathogenesis [Mameliella alba]